MSEQAGISEVQWIYGRMLWAFYRRCDAFQLGEDCSKVGNSGVAWARMKGR